MNAGDYTYANVGQVFLNLAVPSLPANLYMAAFTNSVTRTGVGTEVADPASNSINYARKQLPASAWGYLNPGLFYLINELTFNQAVGGVWGTIQSIAIVTVATGSMAGKVIVFGDVDVPESIVEFDTLQVGAVTNFVVKVI